MPVTLMAHSHGKANKLCGGGGIKVVFFFLFFSKKKYVLFYFLTKICFFFHESEYATFWWGNFQHFKMLNGCLECYKWVLCLLRCCRNCTCSLCLQSYPFCFIWLKSLELLTWLRLAQLCKIVMRLYIVLNKWYCTAL